MTKQQEYLQDIHQIRSMMERSSRFISLSGLSGVFAGIFALIGAAFAYFQLGLGSYRPYYDGVMQSLDRYGSMLWLLVLDAVLVLLASVSVAIFLTTRKAKKHGQKIWDATARRLVFNVAIPLVAGGIFCIALLYHGIVGLVAPATLVFYGIALVNGSKYTLNDIRYLGFSELALGLISLFFIGKGFLFWILGFGLLHIVYGTLMYYKYERKG